MISKTIVLFKAFCLTIKKMWCKIAVMKTKLLNPNAKSIELACSLIAKGEVVAVPTETVYGLAADARNGESVKKIFQAKGRPQDNPLIVHISNMKMLDFVVSSIPNDAKILAKNFWPGPLTIIMPKSQNISSVTSAGLDSVGVRMPSNEIAREIIEKSNIPFAAPSANISGKPSPTTAEDVFVDMNGKIPLIIDGGTCDAGVESTVVSCLGNTPIILRPGVITKEIMEKVLNKKVEIAKAVVEGVKKDEKVLSPGMKYKHYSPNAEVIIVKSNFENFKKFVENKKEDGIYALCFDGEEKKLSIPSLSYGKENDAKSQAHNLFEVLRKLDKLSAKKVYARCPSIDGVGLAVYNRLIRSAGFNIIEL